MTHCARDVRAGGPLAVGPRRAGAAAFFLLAQQLAMLLLPVLHVDEQRDEAVLHLGGQGENHSKVSDSSQGGGTSKNRQRSLTRCYQPPVVPPLRLR